MPTLINFDSNWADEMDVSGFLITKDSPEKVIEQLKHNYMQQTFDESEVNLSPEELKLFKEAQKKYKPFTVTISKEDEQKLLNLPITMGIGTNEDIDFDDFEMFLGEHSIEEITEEEYKTIEKLFGTRYGHAPDVSDYSRLTIVVKD